MPSCCQICVDCDDKLDYEYHCYDCFVIVCIDCLVDFDCEDKEEWVDISGDVIMANSCCV